MSFSDYTLRIVTAGAAASLAVRLIPESSGGRGLRRSVVYAVTVVLILCLISPLAPALASFGERAASGELNAEAYVGQEADLSRFYSAVAEEAGREIAGRIEEKTAERFAVAEGAVAADVRALAGESGVVILRVTLTLSGRGILIDPRELEDYVAGLTGCAEIEILY